MQRRRGRWRSGGVLAALLLGMCRPAWSQVDEATVALFSPQGQNLQVHQATARFSTAMVPFSTPDQPLEPFAVDCAAPGKGRWVDQRTWVFQFEDKLPGGMRCRFTLRDGLHALDGRAVGGQKVFAFDTGGPAVLDVTPHALSRLDRDTQGWINEDQLFVLQLNAPVAQDTLVQQVRCVAGGISEEIPVAPLAEDALRHMLAFEANANSGTRPGLYQAYQQDKQYPGTVVALQCKRTLPANAEVQLIWPAGLTTPSGVATTTAQRFLFKVREPLRASMSCSRENAAAGCLPIAPIHVHFTAAIPLEQARKIVLRTREDTQRFAAELPQSAERVEAETDEVPPAVTQLTFAGPFPQRTALVIEMPQGLHDEEGRSLSNAAQFPLEVAVDRAPPLAKFSTGRFGILEQAAGGILPLTIRHVEQNLQVRRLDVPAVATGADAVADIWQRLRAYFGAPDGGAARPRTLDGWVQQVGAAGDGAGEDADRAILQWLERLYRTDGSAEESYLEYENRDRPLPLLHAAPQTKALSVPLDDVDQTQVIGIPLQKPGFYVVELASPALGAALLPPPEVKPGEKPRAPGPMYVRTMALVTNLAVHFKKGAASSLVWVTTLDRAHPVADAHVAVRDCQGALLWQGTTNTDGVALIPQALADPNENLPCSGSVGRYFVSARTTDDMAFALSSWQEGLEPWRFNMPTYGPIQADLAHTIMDRTLLRPGETVHMKHLLRKTTAKGLTWPEAVPTYAVLIHAGTGAVAASQQLDWDSASAALTQWTIPSDARLGTYRVVLSDTRTVNGDEGSEGLDSGSFQVEAFRVPLMKGQIAIPTAPVVGKSPLSLAVDVRYLAGGGAAGLPAVLRWGTEARTVEFAGFDGFTFANGAVREGLERADRDTRPLTLAKVPVQLDEHGSATVSLGEIPLSESAQDIMAELEYRDPNGEAQTVSRRIPWWPASVVVGIKAQSWLTRQGGELVFVVATLSPQGKPAAGVPVEVALLRRQTMSHRKRLVGGFYAYENTSRIMRLGEACRGRTGTDGLLHCRVKASVSGELLLVAQAAGAAAHAEVWVHGGDEAWFGGEDHDRMDVLAERKHYEPGEKARLQVRMPFRHAFALVTVEREGILRYRVESLSGRDPVVETPILGTDAPNVFVSVLAVRGRVADIQPTATVDLGRPAFKLGYVGLDVGWRAHSLEVQVTPRQEVYPVRAQAEATIQVRRTDGQALPADATVALAVVDDGLLQLKANDSWDVLPAMMARRGLGVETSTAAMQVVGKRHFGKKAAPPGGGGGVSSARELFDALLSWQPAVHLDAQGRATVSIPVNDSLTSFTLAAMATAGSDAFGTGRGTLRTSQDVMAFSGLPPVVRQGDQYVAEFTVRNTLSRGLAVQARLEMTFDGLTPTTPEASQGQAAANLQAVQSLQLAPQASQVVRYPIQVPQQATASHIQFMLTDAQGKKLDALRITQQVAAPYPVRTWQQTLVRLKGQTAIPVAPPAHTLPGTAALQATLASTLVGSLDGVRRAMRAYPYSCLEQQVSQAVVLDDPQAIMPRLGGYQDADGLLRFWPCGDCPGSDVLTSYVLTMAHEAGWTVPGMVRQRALDGLRAFVEGRLLRGSVLQAPDETLRKLAALAALARYGQANRATLDALLVDPALLPTSAVLNWIDVTGRLEGYPQAPRQAVLQMLRSRLDMGGARLGLVNEDQEHLYWLLLSPDATAAHLLALVVAEPSWQEDAPRLATGLLDRQVRGQWDLTTANAWGMLALRRFAQHFEQQAPTGASHVILGARHHVVNWQPPPGQTTKAEVRWPLGAPETLQLLHLGAGAPWVTLSSLAARRLDHEVHSGYVIARTITAVERRDPNGWHVGDVLRVHLAVRATSGMAYVVVADPIPSGATILGGVHRAALLEAGERAEGVWPAYEERTFTTYRAYYDFLPQGDQVVEYTMRLNQSGRFELPGSRVEAMYAPERYAELPGSTLVVLP